MRLFVGGGAPSFTVTWRFATGIASMFRENNENISHSHFIRNHQDDSEAQRRKFPRASSPETESPQLRDACVVLPRVVEHGCCGDARTERGDGDAGTAKFLGERFAQQ